ncbi:ABC transporter ATP-binding protein [Herbivorax sp. ANBcel31]|uniref:ABC transporter ATP-binding protein n=1 Tax=Herbivorax sp. ANBcel31 TaxID=3069754 RepID=UPI0027B2F556|nr:ABC transporter ATP-binding protein [Herbivorax sp. ANBcel31]MDQ2085229.1 ABC transporter ATP-binding protein [Herbivorax sp. ANBcel31]
MLEVIDLVKNYGKKQAVKGISFTVKPGEIFGFLGHNGAGKSTTIKICSGLLKPTSGNVKICGHDIASHPIDAKRNLGYVPENPYLYSKLTGREFLMMVSGIYSKKVSKDELKRIDDLLEELQIIDDADKLIGTYSQGMRRKITVGAAILHRPKVLLLDEPTTALDAVSAKVAKDLFRKYANEGSAILFTTHIMEIAERICDRIGVIYQGELIAVGTLNQLKEKAALPGSTLEDIFVELTKSNQMESDGSEG